MEMLEGGDEMSVLDFQTRGTRCGRTRRELLPWDLDDRTHICVARAVVKISMQSQHAFARNRYSQKKKLPFISSPPSICIRL